MQHLVTANVFEGVSYSGIVMLAESLRRVSEPLLSHIYQIYREEEVGFETHLDFCRRLNVISVTDDIVTIKSELFFNNVKQKLDATWLLRFLLEGSSVYAQELEEFWIRYIDKVSLEFNQRKYLVNKTAHTRDFLIQIGVFLDLEGDGDYRLTDASKHLFLSRSFKNSKVFSPKALSDKIEDKGRVGAEAEVHALDYEKARLGRKFVEHVEHVSLNDVSCGYDIKSLTLMNDTRLPRFIEVKAVPPSTKRFYLSAGETQTARYYGELYYLYLFPVINGKINIDDLLIFQDPYRKFFNAEEKQWLVEPDGYCIKQDL